MSALIKSGIGGVANGGGGTPTFYGFKVENRHLFLDTGDMTFIFDNYILYSLHVSGVTYNIDITGHLVASF